MWGRRSHSPGPTEGTAHEWPPLHTYPAMGSITSLRAFLLSSATNAPGWLVQMWRLTSGDTKAICRGQPFRSEFFGSSSSVTKHQLCQKENVRIFPKDQNSSCRSVVAALKRLWSEWKQESTSSLFYNFMPFVLCLWPFNILYCFIPCSDVPYLLTK